MTHTFSELTKDPAMASSEESSGDESISAPPGLEGIVPQPPTPASVSVPEVDWGDEDDPWYDLKNYQYYALTGHNWDMAESERPDG